MCRRMLSLALIFFLLCGCEKTPEITSDNSDSGSVVIGEMPVTDSSFVLESSSVISVEQDDITPNQQEIRDIIATVHYDDNHFVTEKDFYQTLDDILAVYNIEMTPCADGSAYYCFAYDNITNVKLLTLSLEEKEILKDIASANAQYEEKNKALESGDSENAQYRGIIRDIPFDPNRDVRNSDYRVASFVVTCSPSGDDQSLFYMVSSAAYAILQPKCTDDREAFDSLKENVFSLYANNTSDTDYVSWIEGIDYSKSLTIPGNAVECWFSTKEDQSLWLNITMYIYYDHKTEVLNPT